MKVYTVHEPHRPETAAADRVDRGERFTFVADVFDGTAALFAPLVLLSHKVWFGLALYVVAAAAIVAVFSALGADRAWIALGIAALHVFIGFEYGELRRAQLDATGWTDLGPVSGRSLADCERRFYEAWLPGQPLLTVLGSQPGKMHEVAHPIGPHAPAPVAGWRARWPW